MKHRLKWREDGETDGNVVLPKTAVKTKPSYPNLTDERQATDPNLWKRVLQVASGDLREFTEGGRTIHAPNDGRGYRNMPHNPKGIAWAIKQYNGYGGNWKGQKEALRILAAGGSFFTPQGQGLPVLESAGFVRLAGEYEGRRYWDVTVAGLRFFTAGLKEDLVHKVDALERLGDKYEDGQAISDEDKAAIAEFAIWFRKHFGRVDSTKTPRGQKRLKEEAVSFLKALELYGSGGGTSFSGVLKNIKSGPWGRTLAENLDALVQYFTVEGNTDVGKRAPVVELKLSHAVYLNKSIASEANFQKYAQAIDTTFGQVKGWRSKALKGNLKVVFQGASQMKTQGKYVQAKDEMWVKATPAIMKRSGGAYASPQYILVHELGHRYEKFNSLPTDFDQAKWWTTRYSRTQSFGGSESFAELFALGHFKIKGDWDPSVLDRFEDVMQGRG